MEVESDLCLIVQDVLHGVSTRRAQATTTAWQQWEQFCTMLSVSPLLAGIRDPIPFLLVFQLRWRDGRISPKGQPVMARTAEDAVRQVGQTFSLLGASDPRYDKHGKVDFRLRRQVASWKRRDRPTQRRTPVPGSVLEALTTQAWRQSHQHTRTMSDLMWLGFYFLLRPSEYLKTSNLDQTPFQLSDVHFRANGRQYTALTLPLALGPITTAVGLHFTWQKNGITGEIIWQGTTSHEYMCPVRAATRLVLHLREHLAPPTTPLHQYFNSGKQPCTITAQQLTAQLRLHATSQALDVDVSAGALRATGATSMLNSNVNVTTIKLLGRWRSDAVMRYFHVQSHLSEPLAHQMFSHLT